MAEFLIVVDMQNDFIDGALGTAEATRIVDNVIERINAAKAGGETVIATLDTHGENYMDTPEGKKLPVPHCIKGTFGWEIRADVRAALGDAVLIEKPTFGSMELPCVIREIADGGDISIELLGLCTDICVVSNALLLKAAFPNADISVRESCSAGVTPEKHAAAIETMKSCQIDIV